MSVTAKGDICLQTETKFLSGEASTETESPNISISPRKPASLKPKKMGRTEITIPAPNIVKIEYFVE
jgi:hypothetical protein